MTLEERFEALMKQNEFLSKKIQEDAQKNQETQAQNEYLRKQLGYVLKQKQKLNEDTLQSEPTVHEQVFSHEVDSSSEEESIKMTREEPRFQATSNDFKVEVPEYEGKLDPEEFSDWLHPVERVFEYKDIPEDKKVKLVALRFRKYASLWWTNLCANKVRERKSKIRTWEKMKSKLKAWFLPSTYVQDCYSQLYHLNQGNLSVEEYTCKFEKLVIKCDL